MFADSGYFIALLNPDDQWRPLAIAASRAVRDSCWSYFAAAFSASALGTNSSARLLMFAKPVI
jgi:hypothetical protein